MSATSSHHDASLPLLVIGSYPPVRTPGAAATLAAVRRAIAAGDDPIVASPRPSAARYDVPVSGVFAGRRLSHLQELTGARRLILCAERDLPLPTTFAVPALVDGVQRRTLRELQKAAATFESVTIVLADDLGVSAQLEAGLRSMADEVIDERGRRGDARVTVLGPDAETSSEQLAALSRKLGRRALGPLAPRVRPVLVRMVHKIRA